MTKHDNLTYRNSAFRKVGASGLKLPAISLGLWHNFGTDADLNLMRDMLFAAFDNGITHFDLANNYGPLPGSAETNFGKILKSGLNTHRDELIVSTKAGYPMWEGPYGDGGSKKYLTSSIDQSLIRLDIDYVDVFYHHRRDTFTPLEETMYTLDRIVKDGKALYVGISNYNKADTEKAMAIMRELRCPLIVNQVRYSMMDRHIEEDGLLDFATNNIGLAIFSPLEQGILTDRYLKGIPDGSRAKLNAFLKQSAITEELLAKVKALNEIAKTRGQTLAQMSLSWVLSHKAISTVIIGASSVEQIKDNITAGFNTNFSDNELQQIDKILGF